MRASLGDVTSDLRKLTSCRQIHVGDGRSDVRLRGTEALEARVNILISKIWNSIRLLGGGDSWGKTETEGAYLEIAEEA